MNWIKRLLAWWLADHVRNEAQLRAAIKNGSRIIVIHGNIIISKHLAVPVMGQFEQTIDFRE